MKTESEIRRGRVLVVDDKISNRELLRQELEADGFEVATAASGKECLDKVLSFAPDVVILDIQMPGMDGIEACRHLRSEPATSHIPVLFLTGHETHDEACLAALKAGGNDFLVKPYNPAVLLARVSSQVAFHRARVALRQTSIADDLTGVYSRRYLVETLRQRVREGTRRAGARLACLMIDLDHFKPINDRLGSSAGDEVLRHVASIVQAALRGSDIVARVGGEEFSVLLPDADADAAGRAAERVRAAVEQGPHPVAPVTVSVGIGLRADLSRESVERDGGVEEVVRALLRDADDALFRAKSQGRNRVFSIA